jgi:hypothetical protein
MLCVPLRRVHAVEGAGRLFFTSSSGACGRPLRGRPRRRVPGRTGSPQPTARRSTAPPCPPRACLPAAWWRGRVGRVGSRSRLARTSASSVRFADDHLTALPSPLRRSITSGRRPSRSFIPRSRSPATCSSPNAAAIARCSTWTSVVPTRPTIGRAGRSKESRASIGRGGHIRQHLGSQGTARTVTRRPTVPTTAVT